MMRCQLRGEGKVGPLGVREGTVGDEGGGEGDAAAAVREAVDPEGEGPQGPVHLWGKDGGGGGSGVGARRTVPGAGTSVKGTRGGILGHLLPDRLKDL